ncbi:uncharacterized protein [Amphiura filiformis]|uniref:uncharacterized protein n=1 Tax=Amphiura filiformis TaxID=82378 RepID=UPI003B223FD4
MHLQACKHNPEAEDCLAAVTSSELDMLALPHNLIEDVIGADPRLFAAQFPDPSEVPPRAVAAASADKHNYMLESIQHPGHYLAYDPPKGPGVKRIPVELINEENWLGSKYKRVFTGFKYTESDINTQSGSRKKKMVTQGSRKPRKANKKM